MQVLSIVDESPNGEGWILKVWRRSGFGRKSVQKCLLSEVHLFG